MLKVSNLTKQFSSAGTKVIAVNDVKFSLPEGCFAAIVGRSGSGKTTLLSLLGALEKPDQGSIEVDNQDVAKLSDHDQIKYRCQKIGFVFQSYNLVPNLTALENVMLPMEYAGLSKELRLARAKDLLNQVGLTENESLRKPSKLSGGQQQRVAIARALANKPKLILADEPTGNLDSQTGNLIIELLQGLAKSEQTTIIAVTHDLSLSDKADKTFKIEDGVLKAAK